MGIRIISGGATAAEATVDWDDIPDGSVGIVNLDSTISTPAKDLLDDPNVAAMRATLELDELYTAAAEGESPVFNGTDWDNERRNGSHLFGQLTPAVGTKPISIRPNFRGIVTGVTTKLTSGTLTVAILVDGVAVPGLTAVSVTSSYGTVAASGSGVTFNHDSVITYTISSPSSATEFTGSLLVTRIRNT